VNYIVECIVEFGILIYDPAIL